MLATTSFGSLIRADLGKLPDPFIPDTLVRATTLFGYKSDVAVRADDAWAASLVSNSTRDLGYQGAYAGVAAAPAASQSNVFDNLPSLCV